MSSPAPAFESVLSQALQLSEYGRARLIERLAATLGRMPTSLRYAPYGVVKDVNLSDEDITTVRHEMLNDFPRGDV